MPDHRLYIEHQDDGRYAVKRPNAQRASDVFETQAKAIVGARKIDDQAALHS